MVKNTVQYKTVYSDLVYPDWTNRDKFQVLGILDNEFVEEELQKVFEADSIANKYAIQMDNGLLWYKHDHKVFLLKPYNL